MHEKLWSQVGLIFWADPNHLNTLELGTISGQLDPLNRRSWAIVSGRSERFKLKKVL